MKSARSLTFHEPLEDRRLLSAVVDAAHAVIPKPNKSVFAASAQLSAQASPSEVAPHTKGVPQLSSRPGAAYTIYLNVAGFNYEGTWYARSGEVYTPGFTPSLNDVSPTGTFSAAEQTQIRKIWSTVAQCYVGLDVNVTTVDPYNKVNDPTPTDAERQDYYDATPNMMHTVIGSQVRAPGTPITTEGGKWYSDDADGVSPGIGVVAGRHTAAVEAGEHTNWMFSEAQAGAGNGGVINGLYIGGIAAHENAHSFGLYHQGDYAIEDGETVQVAEYSTGDDSTGPNNFGTYVPTIGDANGKQRIAWRDGTVNNGEDFVRQNDLKVMLATNTAAKATAAGRTGGVDLHFVDDGIGNTLATATPLPLTGSTVNPALAKGVIVPKSESNPLALGAANYTTDWFSFVSNGTTPITLSVVDSTQFLVTGVADGAGTLNSTLNIYRANGTLAAASTQNATTLIDTFTGTLPAGTYYAAVGSNGGHQQVNDADYVPASYFDTGAFFLTGSGFGSTPAGNAPVVTDGPLTKTAAAGATVTFSAAATGTPTPTVQWQVSTNGGSTYANIAGATSTTYSFTAAAAQNGYKYRAVFTNSAGSATTAVATLTVTGGAGATISGTVFNDRNGSGTRDAGEGALAGVRVYMDTNKSGTFNPGEPAVFTNANGVYTFANLPAGKYAVRTQPPTGFQQNFPFGVSERTVTVAAGGVVTGQDFGNTTSSHVGGFVRVFRNGANVGLAGVKVTIKAADGTGSLFTRTTDSTGYYGIGGLANKAYTVTLQLPAGYKLASGSVVRTTPALASGKNADDINYKLLETFA